MMTYEEFQTKEQAILQEMRDSKKEEGRAKLRAHEECNMEHRRLKLEMHDGMEQANMKRNAKLDEIHDRFVAERNRLYARHNALIAEWREQNGISTPPPYIELPSGGRPNGEGGTGQ